MSTRIPWDRYEIALLFNAYEHVVGGADINKEAAELSSALRRLAIRRSIAIDDTYRNVNGMKMQLANVQYLFTDGQKGLSGASSMIRQIKNSSAKRSKTYIACHASRTTLEPPLKISLRRSRNSKRKAVSYSHE